MTPPKSPKAKKKKAKPKPLAKQLAQAVGETPMLPKKGKVNVTVTVSTPMGGAQVVPGTKSPELLKLTAGAKYLASFDGLALSDLAQDPELKAAGVTLAMLQEWSAQGGWVGARKAMYIKVFSKLREKLETDLTDVALNRLKRFRDIEARLFERLMLADVHSLDGGVRAYVQLVEAMERVEAMTRNALDGAQRAHGAEPTPGNALSSAHKQHMALIPESTRNLARDLIKKNQAEIKIKPIEVPAVAIAPQGPLPPPPAMLEPQK